MRIIPHNGTNVNPPQGGVMSALPESADVRDWARLYTDIGWLVVPLERHQGEGKRPKPSLGAGWQRPERLAEFAANIDHYFAPNDNIGLALGVHGSRLIDVDLDDEHACRLAPYFLPPTNLRFGRASAPRSHWLYACDEPCASAKWVDSDGKELLGLRADGQQGATQSMCPPSLHAGANEVVRWDDWGVPAPVDVRALRLACERLAGAALLARVWREGARHNLSLALSGALLRAGWSLADIETFLESLCRGLGDVEWLDRVQSVRDSYDRIQAEREAWGFPKLVELVGERFAHKLAEFLHIPRRADNTSQTPARPAARGGASAGLRLARAVLEQAAERFVDADGRAGLTLQRDGRTETYWVESKAFERVLLARAAEQGIVPRASVLDETRAILIGECWRDPVMRTPALRVAGQPDAAVYVDLGDDAWRVVQVDSNGWQIVPYAIALPVRFVRPYGMTALPTPQRGGDITLLRRFLRLNDEGFWLLVAWLLGCYLPDVQYPILALSGPPGSGKTFATRILRQLVDPRSVPFSALPRDAGDLWAYAMGSYLLAFDNASRIDADLSDLLCGAATEGGAELRQYHTRLERVGVRFRRPVLLNGVPSLAQKSDLADRFITLELHPIPDSERRAETALRAEWEQVYPLVLGALLSGVASAIRHWGRIQIPLPRLGDFALWAAGGLRAYGVEPAQFLEWYTGNRLGTACDLADSSALCEGVRLLLADRDEWRGTPSELLTALRERLGERRDQLPNSPRHLSSRLRMETPLLVALGIAVETGREGKARQRVVRLRKADDGGRYEILASAVASALDVNNLCLINGEADAKTGADATTLNCETQKQSEETYAPAAIVSENIEFQRPSRPPAVGSANFVPDPRVFEADANLPVASASPSSVRHPDLADLLASRRDGHALVAWLWYWAESRDFPALAFDSGQRIIGCKSAWLAFLRTAELDKLERARRAAE